MTESNTMTPQECAAYVSAALDEAVNSRQVIHWARYASAGFPPLAKDLHRKLIRFDRAAVEAWAEQHRVRDSRVRRKVVRRGPRPRA